MNSFMAYHEIETQEELERLLQKGGVITRCVFRDVDFNRIQTKIAVCRFEYCLFMGCRFTRDMKSRIDVSNHVFSHIDVPYNAFRNHLYSAESLYDGYRYGVPESYEESYDRRVYKHYLAMGKNALDVRESLARTLHDHAIGAALRDFLSHYEERRVVGVMGGHALTRLDPGYARVAHLGKRLTEAGFLMITGGGPGAMEATHLGAWMAGRSEEELSEALSMLAAAPSFDDPLWLDVAFQVRQRFPQTDYYSLGIPTWLYGHEPATPFATHIAKYFENALREDGLLALAMGGIIYTPGSAGTMQEIFQDAVQNHYLSFGYASPMVFLDKEYWTQDLPIYPLLHQLHQRGRYKNLLLSITDDISEIVETITCFYSNP